MKKEKHRNTAPLFQVEAEPETAQLAWENWHGGNELVTQRDDLSPFYYYTGTSALIIYISNIQGTKNKYSAVMY